MAAEKNMGDLQVLLVEGYKSLRKLITGVLEERGHTVISEYLPERTRYQGNGHTFGDPQGLVDLVMNSDTEFGAVVLDRDTFQDYDRKRFLKPYVHALVDAGYEGMLVVTATEDERYVQDELGLTGDEGVIITRIQKLLNREYVSKMIKDINKKHQQQAS